MQRCHQTDHSHEQHDFLLGEVAVPKGRRWHSCGTGGCPTPHIVRAECFSDGFIHPGALLLKRSHSMALAIEEGFRSRQSAKESQTPLKVPTNFARMFRR